MNKENEEKISMISYFLKSFSKTLINYPILNSFYFTNEKFEYNLIKSHNFSFSNFLESKEKFNLIDNCQKLSIYEIEEILNKDNEQSNINSTISFYNSGKIKLLKTKILMERIILN